MEFKIVFLVAVALKASFTSATTYEEVLNEADVLWDTITEEAMHHYLTHYNKTLALKCIKEERTKFEDFATTVSTLLTRAGSELGVAIGPSGKLELAYMVQNITTLPKTFWPIMLDGAPEKALGERRNAGIKVRESAKQLAKIIEDLARKDPDDAQKALQKLHDVHEEGKKKSRAMNTGIRDCVWKASEQV